MTHSDERTAFAPSDDVVGGTSNDATPRDIQGPYGTKWIEIDANPSSVRSVCVVRVKTRGTPLTAYLILPVYSRYLVLPTYGRPMVICPGAVLAARKKL